MTGSTVTAKTVVIADDTAFVRDRFRTAVENAGHKAIAVKSAAELLARVRADLDQIDLIVLDLRLPHAPGVDLVRAVRKLDDGRLPILVFSGTIASNATTGMRMTPMPSSTAAGRPSRTSSTPQSRRSEDWERSCGSRRRRRTCPARSWTRTRATSCGTRS